MIKYPVMFHAVAESESGIQTTWNFESQRVKNVCAIPVEFEGPGGALSPEDLFAQALTNCFLATFKVYAEKSKLLYGSVSAHSELIVDLNLEKKPVMKDCTLRVNITGCAEPERVKVIAHKAFQSGFILNSVKTDLHFELDVSGTPARG